MAKKSKFILILSTVTLCFVLVAVSIFIFGSAAKNSSSQETGDTDSAELSSSEELSSSQTEVSSASSSSSSSQQSSSSSAVDPNQRIAYLTFDDGPCEATPQLLDILKSLDVKVTFFVIGTKAEKYPDVLKRMVAEGHVVGIHTWTHDYKIYTSTDTFLADFNKLKDFITTTTGVAPDVCRFPGGTNNETCFQYNKNHIMKQIAPLVESMGFRYIDWNASTGEANAVPPTTDTIVSNVMNRVKTEQYSVILFHDYNIQDFLDAVPILVSKLRSEGFIFRTLSKTDPSDAILKQFQFDPS